MKNNQLKKVTNDMYVILPENFEGAFTLERIETNASGNPRFELTGDIVGIARMLKKGFNKKRGSDDKAVLISYENTEDIARWTLQELGSVSVYW